MQDDSAHVDGEADFTFGLAGGKVRVIPLSDRALEWFWGDSPPELRDYFHYRRYGDTPFGWYTARRDCGFERLLALLAERGFQVVGP